MTQQNDAAPQSSECENSSKSTCSGNEIPNWAEGLKEPEFKIKLKNYRFKKDKEDKRSFFVGRDKERLKLKNILESNWNSGGAYLVAGYRGVGKTEFVKKTLCEYEDSIGDKSKDKNQRAFFSFTKRDEAKKAKKVLQVHVSLGNEKRLDSTLVLSDVVSLMFEEFKCKNKLLLYNWSLLVPLFILFFLLLFSVLGQLFPSFVLLTNVFSESKAGNLFRWVYSLSVILTVIWCFGSFLKYRLSPAVKIHYRLLHLLTNMTYSSEKNYGAGFKGI